MIRRLALVLMVCSVGGAMVVVRAEDTPLSKAISSATTSTTSSTLTPEQQAADKIDSKKPVGTNVAPGLDLRKQLEKDLYCRRPVEFRFVERVVKRIEEGTLPRDLVVSTYGWAREKPTMRIQYFEFALRKRAVKAGYSLDGLEIGDIGLARGIRPSAPAIDRVEFPTPPKP